MRNLGGAARHDKAKKLCGHKGDRKHFERENNNTATLALRFTLIIKLAKKNLPTCFIIVK